MASSASGAGPDGQQAGGGGLPGGDDSDAARWSKARELALVVGMPRPLCYQVYPCPSAARC